MNLIGDAAPENPKEKKANPTDEVPLIKILSSELPRVAIEVPPFKAGIPTAVTKLLTDAIDQCHVYLDWAS